MSSAQGVGVCETRAARTYRLAQKCTSYARTCVPCGHHLLRGVGLLFYGYKVGGTPFIPVIGAIYGATVSCGTWAPSLLACNPLLCNMQYRSTDPVGPLKSKR